MDTISERAENILSELFRLSEQAAVGTDKETLRQLYAEMMFHLGQLNAFEPLVGPFDVVLQSPFANHQYEVSVTEACKLLRRIWDLHVNSLSRRRA